MEKEREKKEGKLFKKTSIAVIGVIALIYLMNPGWGVFEFLPDNLPIVGNLDEAGATALLLSSLAYYGINIHSVFKPEEKEVLKEKNGNENG